MVSRGCPQAFTSHDQELLSGYLGVFASAAEQSAKNSV